MISFGAVLVQEKLDKAFGKHQSISDKFTPDALAVYGHTREETLTFVSPEQVMKDLISWIDEKSCKDRPIFIPDKNGFDWMFICWRFLHFIRTNPFGFSSQNLESLYKGIDDDTFKTFKHLRRTKYSHHPVDDAKGNAKALLTMKQELGLKIKL